jgi:endonuclease YncB( thermonuclease family)
MKKHNAYIDLKNKKNYEAEIVGVEDSRTILVSHNDNVFKVKNNATTNIVALFNKPQIEKLNIYLKENLKNLIFNVRVKKQGIVKNVEITKKENGKEEKLPNYLDSAVRNFMESEKKTNSNTFIARFKSHKINNIVTVSTNEADYNVLLDLTETKYFLYNEEDRGLIDIIVREKLQQADLLKISSDFYVGFNKLSKIKYKKDGYWHDLSEEIKNLINPYEETCEKGRQIFHGIVTNVVDGDTIDLFNGIEKVRIRVDDIDAPESDQQCGDESTRLLTQLIYGKEVKIAYRNSDKYNRIVGTIYGKDKDGDFAFNINRKMVSSGMAFAEGITYRKEERKARQEDLGIWVDDPVYPGNFRKNRDYYKNKNGLAAPKWKKNQDIKDNKEEKSKKKSIFNRKK